ncbi:MAG: twin-arginine translocase TatA/TatE family subunit [Anaerolineales bacterium]|nr:twin-arginine translocase TatA/TatE family subunit [Anaerolineales bacterium]MCB8953695.1 twin-arginine translocase TatA/TatE family subunit [Ardenticatenales bacterium]
MINGWEWIIILAVVLLVFGVGRVSKLGEELGKGIKAFRQGLREGQDEEDDSDDQAK